MRLIDDAVWVATSGGLLAISDAGFPGAQFSNVNGLGTIDVTDIIQAADLQKWVTGYGRLIKFDGSNSTRYPFADNNGDMFHLYCVKDDGEYLWVGTERALVLFSKNIDGGQIQDSYQLFDDLNPTFPTSDINDIELVGDSIWLATSSGLVVADRSNPKLLKAPANWTKYGVGEYAELGTDEILRVAAFESEVYVGTANGLFLVDQVNDTLIRYGFAAGRSIRDLKVENDSLFIYSDGGFGVLTSGVVSALSTTGLPSTPCTGVRAGMIRWVGVQEGGLYHGGSGAYELYPYTGLPNNNVADVAITPTGVVTVLFQFEGLYQLLEGTWVQRPINMSFRGHNLHTDRHGWVWAGTWGDGLSRVGDTIAQYSSHNSSLQGVGVNDPYTVAMSVTTSGDHLFASNLDAYDGTAVAIGNLSSLDVLDSWISLGAADGITSKKIVSVDYYAGGLAVGTGQAGVFYYWLGANVFDKSDDRVVRFHEGFKYLASDVVRVVKFASDGELWVGTSFGLSRYNYAFDYFDSYGRFVDINLPAGFGPEITAVEFDGRNNVWLGGRNGLARIDGITGDFAVYTSRNSGLVDDEVVNITIDEFTGDLYLSTPRGLSVMASMIGRPTANLDSVYAFPNPFVVGSADDRLNFNFSRQATLRVFSVAGEVVANLPEPSWDGRNDHGQPVASGVYLYVLTDEDGNVGRGKILLVRE